MTSTVHTPRGVVTPEAVRLEFHTASVGSRGVAWLLDLMLIGMGLLILMALVTLIGVPLTVGLGVPEWVFATVALLASFLVVWGYPTVFETRWSGRTPGKAALGLRVVTREGAPVRFRHAAIRAALGLVDFVLTVGAGAVVAALVTRQHQRLGDLVAGTIVLREGTEQVRPEAVRFTVPPGWERYAATLDPAVLDARSYAAIRAFLVRAARLDPAARAAMAAHLATPLLARLRQRPPPGLGPEQFLICLAARYQAQRGAAAALAPSAG